MSPIIEERDIEVLEKQDAATLAQWWCSMNKHEWPSCDLPYDPPQATSNSRRWRYMCWIMEHIGLKECLREWNRERMSSEVFEAWWESRNIQKDALQ